MHLKNIILFFCVTLFFFQTQGEPTRAEILSRVMLIVRMFVENDGMVEAIRIKEIFQRVEVAFGLRSKQLGSMEEAIGAIVHTYSNQTVEAIILSYVGEGIPRMKTLAREIVETNMPQDSINFDQLKVIFTKVADAAGIPREILEDLAEFQRTNQNSSFNRRQVEIYILAILASEDIEIHGIIKKEIENCQKRGRKAYEDIKEIHKRVKQRKPTALPLSISSRDRFHGTETKTKFPFDDIQNMVMSTYFPNAV